MDTRCELCGGNKPGCCKRFPLPQTQQPATGRYLGTFYKPDGTEVVVGSTTPVDDLLDVIEHLGNRALVVRSFPPTTQAAPPMPQVKPPAPPIHHVLATMIDAISALLADDRITAREKINQAKEDILR